MVRTNGDRQDASKVTAIIPFIPEYDESKLTKIKHTVSKVENQTTEKITAEIPKLSEDAGAHELLMFI